MPKLKKEPRQRQVKSDDLTADELFAVKNLETNDGWLALQKIIRKNIAWLKKQIIEDDDLSIEVRMTQRDLVRQWLKYQKRILNLPSELTGRIEESEETNPVRLDPYPQTLEEIREMKHE